MKLFRLQRIWIFIALYICAIYLTLPVMRFFLNYLYSTLGKENLSIITNIILISVLPFLAFLGIRKGIFKTLLIVIPIIVSLVFILHMERPEERMHFLEYGVLGFMVTKALGLRFKQVLLAVIFISLAGSLDEFIQFFLPNRVGDLRDVVMNAAGGGLGIWVGWLLR
ncbi:MAG TPA: VanZ family protein [Nitrospirae bacterium]|nr:VanZ family protein [Nitrospirota bacterium]